MPSHTQLKGVQTVFDSLLSDQLEANLVGFFQWGLLGAGGFFNVHRPQAGVYGGDESALRPVSDPNYADGQVWEAFRKDWVWETGVEYPAQPIRVSGVYLGAGGAGFVPVGTGLSVDYPNGRVVFAEPRSTSGAASCEYSYRLYQFYTADADWWQRAQTNSFRADDPQFAQFASGAWDTLAQNRVQFPAVVVEAAARADRTRGYQLGDLKQHARQDVLFHVLAEERWHMTWMHDAIMAQQEKGIQGFDKNRLLTRNAFPLDPDGSPRPSGLMYPDLVKPTGEGGYFWEQIRFQHVRSTDQPRLGNLHYCTVRATLEVDTE